jgi:hypothetical protein
MSRNLEAELTQALEALKECRGALIEMQDLADHLGLTSTASYVADSRRMADLVLSLHAKRESLATRIEQAKSLHGGVG